MPLVYGETLCTWLETQSNGKAEEGDESTQCEVTVTMTPDEWTPTIEAAGLSDVCVGRCLCGAAPLPLQKKKLSPKAKGLRLISPKSRMLLQLFFLFVLFTST